MPLVFPANPNVGQTSTQNGRTYTWSGSAWELTLATSVSPVFSGTVQVSGVGGGVGGVQVVSGSSAGRFVQSGQGTYVLNDSTGGNIVYATTGAGLHTYYTNGSMRMVVGDNGIFSNVGGTAALPSIARWTDPDTGLHWPAANTIGVSTGGVERLRIASDGAQTSVVTGGTTLLPQFACRAWVNFAGLAATIRGSGNVSSVTRTAAGAYTVNFTTAMADANYCAVISSRTTASNVNRSDQIASGNTSGTLSTTSLPVSHVENGVAADTNFIMVAVFR